MLILALFLCLALVSPAAAQTCTADCDGDGQVTVDEIVIAVIIALGNRPLDDCLAADSDADGFVTVDEIVTAVNNALEGCRETDTRTPTVTPTATATATGPPGTATATPSVRLDVSSAQGAPGARVTISIALAGGADLIVSASSDITYNAAQVAVVRQSGQIQCRIAFTDPPGSGIERTLLLNVLPAGGSNETLRIGILSATPFDAPLPDGNLVSCDFAISSAASAGAKVLANSPDVAGADGVPLGVNGADGVITVVR